MEHVVGPTRSRLFHREWYCESEQKCGAGLFQGVAWRNMVAFEIYLTLILCLRGPIQCLQELNHVGLADAMVAPQKTRLA
jgi:hypothetical protein